MSGYEIVTAEPGCEWSLGVYESRQKAEKVIDGVKRKLSGELTEFDFSVEPTNEMPRMAIMPNSPYHEQWSKVRQRKLSRVPA